MPELIVSESTWIISDTHFGHENIIKYCGRPRNHNLLMKRAWKKLVKKEDVILHLGDVIVWYGLHNTWAKEVLKLPGRKFLILGNHDLDLKWTNEEWISKTGMTVIEPFQQGKTYFSHEPLIEIQDWTVELNIHGHSHNHMPAGHYMKFGLSFYNASIEGMSYKPRRLGEILKEVCS
jgi:calcineurin-like phosphoesterase family protein